MHPACKMCFVHLFFLIVGFSRRCKFLFLCIWKGDMAFDAWEIRRFLIIFASKN